MDAGGVAGEWVQVEGRGLCMSALPHLVIGLFIIFFFCCIYLFVYFP